MIKNLEQENYLLLGDVVDILSPKKINNTETKVVKTKDFKYPIDLSTLSDGPNTNIKLKQGDILFSASFSGAKKFHLINNQLDKDIHPSTFLKVLRPKIDICPEYLFLYLQSETAQKYFELHTAGTFGHVNIRDLTHCPIPLPNAVTQNKSIEIFKTRYLHDSLSIISDINKQLFDKKKIEKPIQNEFIHEMLNKLIIQKKEIIEDIIKHDLHELSEAKNHKLYKSFVIIAGSLLEAFLLDWMSEIDCEDYFTKYIPRSESSTITLESMINKIFKDNEKLKEMATEIRNRRNLVHPRLYFNKKYEINDITCIEIIHQLKEIFDLRK